MGELSRSSCSSGWEEGARLRRLDPRVLPGREREWIEARKNTLRNTSEGSVEVRWRGDYIQGVPRHWTPGNLAKSQALYKIRHLENIQVSRSCF